MNRLCIALLLLVNQASGRDLVRILPRSYLATDEVTGIKTPIWIDGFLIAPTEVTQQEYADVVGANPSVYKGAGLPVENVSWWDAIRYCNLRSVREGFQPCYDLASGQCDRSRNGYRLPSEAEWSTAAADHSALKTGVELGEIATLGSRDTKDVDALVDRVRKGPTAVASHRPNRYGVYDALGNVWEWCDDFFDPVNSYPQARNPSGPAWGIARVIRGGSFATTSSNWSKGYRSSMEPERHSRFTGFRVCRTDLSATPASIDVEASAWFAPYNQQPKGFETSIGSLKPIIATRAELKKKWEELLGACGPEVSKPTIRTVRVFDEAGYTGTLAALQVEPDASENIYIMKPLRATGKLPVIIVPFYDVDAPAGKDMGGRRYAPPGVRSFALLAVQQGYLAVAIRWFGESYGESYAEAVANLALKHPGCSGMGKWVSDARVLVNYLSSRPDVDARRIGIIGHSLGGKMALYAASMDDRIRVAVASELGIGFNQSNYDDYWYLGKRLADAPPGTDQHELLALMAPRPFLLIGGDQYDGDKSWHYINSARQVYASLGQPRNIGYLNHHTGHTPTPEAVQSAMDWLRHFLSQ